MLILLGAAGLCFGQVTYEGRDADSQWRNEANTRIEKIRKAPLKVQVVDAQGKPIRGARVRVQQQRHAFGFGNILNPRAFQLEGTDAQVRLGGAVAP